MLLNKVLVRDEPGIGRVAARIVEVEAYRGSDDPGATRYRGDDPAHRDDVRAARAPVRVLHLRHALVRQRRRRARTGDAGAVLLRAAAPLDGIDVMQAPPTEGDAGARPVRRARPACARRSGSPATTTAPTSPRARCASSTTAHRHPPQPFVRTRIGLSPGRGDEHPWRFCVPGDPHVSRAPARHGTKRPLGCGHGQTEEARRRDDAGRKPRGASREEAEEQGAPQQQGQGSLVVATSTARHHER